MHLIPRGSLFWIKNTTSIRLRTRLPVLVVSVNTEYIYYYERICIWIISTTHDHIYIAVVIYFKSIRVTRQQLWCWRHACQIGNNQNVTKTVGGGSRSKVSADVTTQHQVRWWRRSGQITNNNNIKPCNARGNGWSSVVHGFGPEHQKNLLGTNPWKPPPWQKACMKERQPSPSSPTTGRDSKFLNAFMASTDTDSRSNGISPKTEAATSNIWQTAEAASSNHHLTDSRSNGQ